MPTLREPDGLAMSSRNVYLTAEQRAVAPDLYRALLAGAAAAGVPGAAAKDVVVAATSALLLPEGRLDPDAIDDALARPRFELEYAAVVDEGNFVPEGPLGPRSRLVVAARLGSTRLIEISRSPSPRHGRLHRLFVIQRLTLIPRFIVIQRVPRQGRDRMKGRTMATVFVNGGQQAHVREGLVRIITGSIEFPSNGDADMIKITDEVKGGCAPDRPARRYRDRVRTGRHRRRDHPGVRAGRGAGLPRSLRQGRRPAEHYNHNDTHPDVNGHCPRPCRPARAVAGDPFRRRQASALAAGQRSPSVCFDNRPRERTVIVQTLGVR